MTLPVIMSREATVSYETPEKVCNQVEYSKWKVLPVAGKKLRQPINPPCGQVGESDHPREPALKPTREVMPAPGYTDFIGNTLGCAAVGCLVSATLPGSSAESAESAESIEVNKPEILANIGREQQFPANGTYIQTVNLDATKHASIPTFSGQYSGNGFTIQSLKQGCLFRELSGQGIVQNVAIKRARIKLKKNPNSGPRGIIACRMSGSSVLRDSSVVNSVISQPKPLKRLIKRRVYVGALAGVVEGQASLSGNKVKGCQVDTKAYGSAGILVGQASNSSSMKNNTVENCGISGLQNANIGLIAGDLHGSNRESPHIVNSTLRNNLLIMNGDKGRGGGGAGYCYNALINKTLTKNNEISAIGGQQARIGMIIGDANNCKILDTVSIGDDITVKKTKPEIVESAYAGIATGNCKNSEIDNTRAINCTVTAGGLIKRSIYDREGHAGIAAGKANNCKISRTTVSQSEITANGPQSCVGGAVGYAINSRINQTVVEKSRISSNGTLGGVAVGLGGGKSTTVYNTHSCCNTVKGKRTGIGVPNFWLKRNKIYNRFACNTQLKSRVADINCAKSNCQLSIKKSRICPAINAATTNITQATSTQISATTLPPADSTNLIVRPMVFTTPLATTGITGTDKSSTKGSRIMGEDTYFLHPVIFSAFVVFITTVVFLIHLRKGYRQGLRGVELLKYPISCCRPIHPPRRRNEAGIEMNRLSEKAQHP